MTVSNTEDIIRAASCIMCCGFIAIFGFGYFVSCYSDILDKLKMFEEVSSKESRGFVDLLINTCKCI